MNFHATPFTLQHSRNYFVRGLGGGGGGGGGGEGERLMLWAWLTNETRNKVDIGIIEVWV